MSSPNVIGHVVEYIQDAGQVRLKLRLRNTLGKTRDVLVDAPADLGDFFETKLTPEILAASAAAQEVK